MTAVCQESVVDWLAVEFVCNGSKMRLSTDQATLEAAILTIGHMVPAKEIAARCGTHPKTVSIVLRIHGAKQCLLCTRYLLCPEGIAPRHVASTGLECEMGGFRINDVERAELIRATNRKLARLM